MESGLLMVELHKKRVPYEEARSRYEALVEKYAAKVGPELAVELQRRAAEKLAIVAETFEELADAWTRLNELGFSDLERKTTFTVIFGRDCHRLRRPDAAVPALDALIRELEAARGIRPAWRDEWLDGARRVHRLLTTGRETIPVDQRRRSESLGPHRCFVGVGGEWMVKEQRRTIVRYSPAELDFSRCRWLRYHPYSVVVDEEFAELAAVDNLRLRLNELTICGNRRLTDRGLASLGSFTHLEALFIQGYGRITFTGVAQILALRSLEVIDFSDSSSIPQDIAKLRPLSNLKELRLSSERLDDSSLQDIASLHPLEILSVPHNRDVTDAGVAHLATLPNLSRLRIDGCLGVTDASLEVLARHGTLTHVEARGCSLTKRGVAAFRASRPDCSLETGRRRATSRATDPR